MDVEAPMLIVTSVLAVRVNAVVTIVAPVFVICVDVLLPDELVAEVGEG